MILSQTAIYALEAVLHLAEHRGGQPVRVDEMAEALGVPRNYLSKILHGMTRVGLLESTRGPKGGFTLARDPSALTLAQVVDPFDDLARGSGCLLGRPWCSDQRPCAAHARWRELSVSVKGFLHDTTIQELSAKGAPVPE